LHTEDTRHVDDVGRLIRSAVAGDERAWTALVDRFSGLVWSVARGYGLGNADAEEVYQTTWLRLAEQLTRLKEPAAVGGWLATTARREAMRTLRLTRRTVPVDDPDRLDRASDEASGELAVLAREDAAEHVQLTQRVWAAFHRLPERCRRLLRLVTTVPPASYLEIAAALEIPVGSIGPTRARCLARLRTLLS
jgi:RNA polymerase sigma factor (sigma-70 family)